MPGPDRLITALEHEIDHLVNGLIGGQLSPAEFHNELLQVLADGHTAAYLAGAGARQLDATGQAMVLRAVADQTVYAERFTLVIEDGELSDAQIRARARLYAGSAKATYWRATVGGADLPYMPTEGCECASNCACSWERRGDLYYWVLGAVRSEHCETCRMRAHASPYVA